MVGENKMVLSRPAWNKPLLLGVIAGVAAFVALFENTFGFLYVNWQREEYSHGFLIPVVTAFLLWQRWPEIARQPFSGSWAGVAVVMVGLALYFAGTLAAITAIDAYALVIVVGGCALAAMGWQAFRPAMGPIALLFLMNPLPAFLYNNLSSQLQLISSQLGVGFIRLFGISVFLEGNVIDLGSYKLQVVEACSGLNYLFPLLTLGVIVAFFMQGKAWMRWVLVLSTVPITILMNSFRIGVIGFLVDRFGNDQAEGFLHFFEGWVIFMACLALLIAEVWLLLRLTGDRRPLREVLVVEFPSRRLSGGEHRLGSASLAALGVLLLAVYPAFAIPQRVELTPARQDFTTFPMQISGWQGRRDSIEQMYLDVLQLDDYVIANYTRPGSMPVNFYSAYYASQRTGESAHSPASCLPGGGWRIESMARHLLGEVRGEDVPLAVNRVVIQQGEMRQLVYYWFQQRGRNVTNEYLVKWFIFWDSLTRSRSDGALVRLVTPLAEGEAIAAADERLLQFAQGAVPMLSGYVPD